MQSHAANVAQYLAELPADRREAVETVRKVILKNIDRKQVEEGMQYGMIGYFIPYSVYPPGYHCKPKQPLPYMGLASQKNYMSLYMMGLYDGAVELKQFEAAWKATGKKLDMGKCCIRFKTVDDLAMDVIAETIRKTSIASYIARYEAVRDEPKEVRAERRKKAAAAKPVKSKAAARRK